MGAGADVDGVRVIENVDLTSLTFGLFAQRSRLRRARSLIRSHMVMRENAPAAPVAPELPRPGQELILVEAQILPQLDVGHLIGSGALIEPAHLDAQEVGCLFNGQKRHRIF